MSAADDPRPRLLAAARAHAEQRGWPWLEPVDIRLTSAAERLWTIRTNAEAVGMNVRIVVRESDAVIVQSGYLAR
ncbi:MAG TPA: hypothetical protein VN914_13095 [Polyangia bacterium]|nr:hypothetical protein [Polyangia bacterium]